MRRACAAVCCVAVAAALNPAPRLTCAHHRARDAATTPAAALGARAGMGAECRQANARRALAAAVAAAVALPVAVAAAPTDDVLSAAAALAGLSVCRVRVSLARHTR